MVTSSIIAVASLLLSFFPLPEKVEYSIAEISIAKKATFSFSIGQIEIHKAGGTTVSLDLLKTEGNNQVMLISNPFTANSGDSIYFRRLLSISGPTAKKPVEKNSTMAQFEKVYRQVGAGYKGIKLHDTLFNKESHVMFITDVMYHNDTTIIASVDTITVKRNSDGYLRGYTAPYRPEAVTMALKNINPSRPIVLRTWMQLLTPEQAKFAIKTRAQMRDKKPYNVLSTNASMVVPGYGKNH